MPATDAFWTKQQVAEDLYTEIFHNFANAYTSSLRGEQKETLGLLDHEDRVDFIASGDAYIAREKRVLQMAETYYVSPLMSRLVTAAADDWPADEPIEAEDWPTQHGFMYVPGGVSTIDIRGQVNSTMLFMWEVQGDRTVVTWWADKMMDGPHIKSQPHWKAMTRYSPWHLTVLKHGKPLPTMLNMAKVIPPEMGEQIRWIETEAGLGYTFPEGYTAEELMPKWGPDRVSAWLVSALRIMQQPLATVERKGMPANLRRRLDRRPVRLKQKAVTVIDFRRRESDFVHHGSREYSHRFLRRGHWRRQPYKRDDGTWDRRRIWIHATICGPQDKPLILRNHVNALMR